MSASCNPGGDPLRASCTPSRRGSDAPLVSNVFSIYTRQNGRHARIPCRDRHRLQGADALRALRRTVSARISSDEITRTTTAVSLPTPIGQ